MDNISTASPTKVTIGSKHTHNTTDTPFNKNFDKGKFGEIVDGEVDDDQVKGGEIADAWVQDDKNKGGEIVGNLSMEVLHKLLLAPSIRIILLNRQHPIPQVTIGATHTHNSTDIDTKKN